MTRPSDSRIRVLVVDDHPLVRRGIEHILAVESDMEMVGEAADGKEAIEKFQECRPHVVLMDLRMPRLDGTEASRLLLQLNPEACIIALTSYAGDEDIYRALEAGVRGYLLKEMMHTEVAKAIRAVHRGHRLLPSKVEDRLADQFPKLTLTDRELEVLGLMARGLSNREIARKLETANGTIKVHVQNILRKLGISDRTKAVTLAFERGILHIASSPPSNVRTTV